MGRGGGEQCEHMDQDTYRVGGSKHNKRNRKASVDAVQTRSWTELEQGGPHPRLS